MLHKKPETQKTAGPTANTTPPTEKEALKAKILDATPLPPVLVSIVHAYASSPPPQSVIDQVNQDLNEFQRNPALLDDYDWTEVSITIKKHQKVDKDSCLANLHGLKLNGIFFKETQENDIAKTKSENPLTELEAWYKWEMSFRDNVRNKPYINFTDSELAETKFEKFVCASICFERALLTGAHFESSILTGADFSEAKMQGADLSLCYAARYILKVDGLRRYNLI